MSSPERTAASPRIGFSSASILPFNGRNWKLWSRALASRAASFGTFDSEGEGIARKSTWRGRAHDGAGPHGDRRSPLLSFWFASLLVDIPKRGHSGPLPARTFGDATCSC